MPSVCYRHSAVFDAITHKSTTYRLETQQERMIEVHVSCVPSRLVLMANESISAIMVIKALNCVLYHQDDHNEASNGQSDVRSQVPVC